MTRAALATAVAIGALSVLPSRTRGSVKPLWTPLLLLVAAIAISLLLGYIAYARSYWILPRQWVASAALTAVAIVWLWAEIARISSRIMPALGPAIWLLALLVMMPQAWLAQVTKAHEFSLFLSKPSATFAAAQCPPPDMAPPQSDDPEKANSVWVDLANKNIACGGKVWHVFRGYYGVDERSLFSPSERASVVVKRTFN